MMESPISGLIAEAVMQRLERMTFSRIQPKLWIRYVDDTFVTIKQTKLEETHHPINSVYARIKFTREEENNNQLPFLDVRAERMTNREFQTTQYMGRTHYNTPELHKKEEEHLYKDFAIKGYPTNFIRRCLLDRQRQEDTICPNTLAILPQLEERVQPQKLKLLEGDIQVSHLFLWYILTLMRPSAWTQTPSFRVVSNSQPQRGLELLASAWTQNPTS
eukprot:g33810.t1